MDEKILGTDAGLYEGDDSLVEAYEVLEVTEADVRNVKDHGDDPAEDPRDADDDR